MVIVRGLNGANREGEVTVVADIPPPEWILRINGRSIPIERVEANAKQRKGFWSTTSGSMSGSTATDSVSCWGSRRGSRVASNNDGVTEDVSMAPSVKRGRTVTTSPSPTERAVSPSVIPVADQNEFDQVKASLVELQQQMVGFQQHVVASTQQFADLDQRITQCTTDVNLSLAQIQTETSYKFDAIMAMLQQQQEQPPPNNPTQ